MASGSDQLVTLRDGLVVPVAAVVLLLDLESRGLDVLVDNDSIVVRPGRLLNDDDRRVIATYRDPLKALIRYCEGVQ